MTYQSLLTDLSAYLQRSDALVTAQFPRFIMLAQDRIVRELKLLGFRTEVSSVFDGNALSSGMISKPSDWLKTIAFYVGTGATNTTHSPVFERTYEYIRTVYPNAIVTDVPRYYGDADYNHWLVGPVPDQAYPFKVAYYGTLIHLDETNSTNWLTDNAPDLLLYACLMEAIPFVKTDERISVWQSMYGQAKAALMAQEIEGLFDTQAATGEPQTPYAAQGR